MKIKIATDFSPTPIGRYKSQSEQSGQSFREKLLVPALRNNDEVVVDFDGIEGVGSSFLEEAFGGLIRHEGFTSDTLRSKLRLVSTEDETYASEAWQYIAEQALRT